jgi:protein-S-isoprenylcysteine O-methyltransferase Ste14
VNDKLSSFIFRTRGIYILLALAVSIVLKYQAHQTTSLSLFFAGLIIAFVSQGFRMYSASYLWGRQAVTEVGADFLCTSGPFAYTRNPLYLGNLIIGIGASIAINEWYAYVLFVLSWVFVYFIVIPYEERFLQQQFGNAYKEYMAHTGRVKPKLRPYKSNVQVTPDYRAGILGEIHAPVVLAILFAVIYVLFVR